MAGWRPRHRGDDPRGRAEVQPDAVIYFCTNFFGAEIAPVLEAELGVPVLDSTALGVWGAMRARQGGSLRRSRGGGVSSPCEAIGFWGSGGLARQMLHGDRASHRSLPMSLISPRAAVVALATTLAATFALPALAQSPTTMRIAGNFSANGKHTGGIEKPFFEAFAKNTGLTITPNYNPMDVLGVQAADALRLLRSGAFDVMSVQIGMASRDDPFFEGIDLVGVATDMAALRKVVDAYREVFDKRLQEKFGAKVLTLWPFGPQVFYCNTAISSLDDLKGLKVRSFTPSMAALIQHLGAAPVTLPFSEVYPALQRGVANCGVTSPTSGNSGKWPEVTTHFLLGLGVGLRAGPLHEPRLLEEVLAGNRPRSRPSSRRWKTRCGTSPSPPTATR